MNRHFTNHGQLVQRPCLQQSGWNSENPLAYSVPMIASWSFIIAALLAASANAQVSKTDDMVSKLQKSHPEVSWNSKSAILADVTCDGKFDAVVLGSQKHTVVIGVVSGAHPDKVQLFSFPIRRDTQDGFCAVPKRIEASPLDCETNEGSLPGCKHVKGCRGFTVMDEECDSFNFYWNSFSKSIAWWRH
jgi:hypothetical protein